MKTLSRNYKSFILLLSLIFSLTSNGYGQSEYQIIDCEEIEIKGRIIIKAFYGPPNYGENPETDSKEEYYFLILNEPLKIISDSYIGPIYELQIVFRNYNRMQLIILDNQEYIIKGQLFPKQSGHHHSDFYIYADEFLMDEANVKRMGIWNEWIDEKILFKTPIKEYYTVDHVKGNAEVTDTNFEGSAGVTVTRLIKTKEIR